ncbi:MAG: hypothetical protein AAFY88_15915, partial [Acidobacteriota bacterium]
LGLAASLLTLCLTRLLLEAATRRDWLEPQAAGGPFAPIRRRRPGVLRFQRAYLGLLIAGLLAAGVWLSLERGLAWLTPGADFSPGTQLFVTLDDPADVEPLSEAIGGRFPELEIRHQGWEPPASDASAGFLLTLEGGDAAPRPAALSSLLDGFDLTVHGLHGIDARLSSARIAASLWALVGSFALLALYLRRIQPWIDRQALSFQDVRSDGAGIFARTVLAVGIDVAVVLVALALLDIPVGMPIVAALLTTVGYSVNDSMVLWSHLSKPGEPRPTHAAPTATLSDHVDALLSRTLLTSLSTAAPALAILAVGLEPLRGFAWAVLVGTVAGTLSSIFIVAPGMAGSFVDSEEAPRAKV